MDNSPSSGGCPRCAARRGASSSDVINRRRQLPREMEASATDPPLRTKQIPTPKAKTIRGCGGGTVTTISSTRPPAQMLRVEAKVAHQAPPPPTSRCHRRPLPHNSTSRLQHFFSLFPLLIYTAPQTTLSTPCLRAMGPSLGGYCSHLRLSWRWAPTRRRRSPQRRLRSGARRANSWGDSLSDFWRAASTDAFMRRRLARGSGRSPMCWRFRRRCGWSCEGPNTGEVCCMKGGPAAMFLKIYGGCSQQLCLRFAEKQNKPKTPLLKCSANSCAAQSSISAHSLIVVHISHQYFN